MASYPPADLTVERIGDLLAYDLPALLPGRLPASTLTIASLNSEVTS